MRIALVIFTDFPEGSGPARRLHMLAKGLAQRGHEIHVVVPQRFRPGPLHLDMDGFHAHWGALTTLDTWNRPSERLTARWKALGLINGLAAAGLDWLFLSNPSLDGVPFLVAARRRGALVMASYDDLRARPVKPSWEDRMRLMWLESADVVIPRLTHLNVAASHFLENHVRSHSPRVPTFILPPLVDPELFVYQPAKAAAFRAKWGIDGTTLISYLGTFWNVEGIPVLLEAASQLAASGEQFKLAISGAAHEGLDCDDVPALVKALDLDDVVMQTGWLSTEDVVAGMAAADILVIPKLNTIANVAGMPAKLGEYLAMGRAVVASRVGEIPRYVTDQEDALLCEPGDSSALAEALRRLIHDVSFRNRLAANSPLTARQHFDYRRIAARLEEAMVQASSQQATG